MRCLVLGCGFAPRAGAVNHDRRRHSDFVDVAHDLDVVPWPWGDGVFDEVVAEDVLEHLSLGFIGFFDECWRMLRADGVVRVRAPMWNSENVAIDPTHVRGYHPQSFDYLDDGRMWGQKYGRLYTERRWRVESVAVVGCNVEAVLSKVGGCDA